jgi:hypothetical protein
MKAGGFMATISEEEKTHRRVSMASNLGTHGMEGLTPDGATLAIIHRYEEGELSQEQFSEAMDVHAYSLVEKRRALAGAA